MLMLMMVDPIWFDEHLTNNKEIKTMWGLCTTMQCALVDVHRNSNIGASTWWFMVKEGIKHKLWIFKAS
jgi:hypothetical protein